MCAFVQMSVASYGGQKTTLDPLELGIIGGCEVTDGAGNHTQVVCKSSKCS